MIALDDPPKREFYAEMCRMERWSTRTLEQKSGIHLASYLTKLLPRKQLEKKLHEAVRRARQRLRESS